MVDENGNYFGLRKTNAQNNGSTMYNFLFNAQGDVIGLVDNMGNFQASYTYDAWGKVLSVKDKNGNEITDPNHIANINPIRYRGYYYDTETGFYYLQSRYYDPTVGRFINADGLVSTDMDGMLSTNMFAYCDNNPVMYVDPDGTCPICGLVLCVSCNKAKEATPIYNPYKLTLPKKPAPSKVDASSLISINGSNPKAPVQVIIAPKHEKNGKSDPTITIKDSYKVTSKQARSNVLDYIIASPEFDPNVFTRGKKAWMKEWRAHNDAYDFLWWSSLGVNARDVDLNERDKYIWDWYAQ